MAKRSAWRHFFDRRSTWTAFVIGFGYIVVFLLIGQLVGWLASAGTIDLDDALDSPENILVGLTIPIGLGALALVLFAHSIGWLHTLFARQPIAGSGWMWIVPTLLVVTVIARLAGADYDAWALDSRFC
ncbi:MAG TPA: hypothetical protein VIP77_08030 [Jiangellaceae bacterium]